MGALKDPEYQALASLRDAQDQQHGWATDSRGVGLKTVPQLRRIGLCEMADDLHRPPAPGLADAVRAAQRADLGSGWRLHLTDPQLDSVMYALRLEARAHSVGPANPRVRQYDSQYKPTSRNQ